jgi:hypothetical protein
VNKIEKIRTPLEQWIKSKINSGKDNLDPQNYPCTSLKKSGRLLITPVSRALFTGSI